MQCFTGLNKGNKDGHLDIISNSALPSANLLGYAVSFVFQDDSAQPHRQNTVKQWKFDHLNPVENNEGILGLQ